MEFTTIEHNEERPGSPYNWRRAYATRIDDNRTALQQERLAQSRARYYIGTRTFVAKDLKDEEIEELARLKAERDCEGAIAQRDENDRLERMRAGISL